MHFVRAEVDTGPIIAQAVVAVEDGDDEERLAAVELTDVVREHQQWSVFWDPKYNLWRAAEDDPNSDLYAESPDAATVIRYITAHS